MTCRASNAIRNAPSVLLVAAALAAGCASKGDPAPRGIGVATVCDLLDRQRADATVMRDHGLAAFQTSAEDFEMSRKYQAGTAGAESVTGKYSQAERRGWQNAFAGATWCQAAELLHAEVIATANLLGDPEIEQLVATRVFTDCSRDMFSTLLTGDPADEARFIAAARQVTNGKAALERALVERCRALAPAPQTK